MIRNSIIGKVEFEIKPLCKIFDWIFILESHCVAFAGFENENLFNSTTAAVSNTYEYIHTCIKGYKVVIKRKSDGIFLF